MPASFPTPPGPLRAAALIDAQAITANVRRLAAEAAGKECCAVVKADGYGHGAVTAARAAVAGGATRLAVVTADEAEQLRSAGITAPLIVLGPLTPGELERTLAADADIVAWGHATLDAATALGGARVHVKLDTGMGRLGTRDRALAGELVRRCQEDPALTAAGVMTHFATADELGDRFFAEQLGCFSDWVAEVKSFAPEVIAHAANSAATLRDAASHFDMIRPGVAIYGLDPFGGDPRTRELAPALTLAGSIAAVKPVKAGESTGYGRRWVAPRDGWVGILPLGYADGVRRALAGRADVIVRGRRFPLVGTVSMDSVAIDLGDEPVEEGEVALLIGTEGDETILAEDLADALGTINYEITCGIGQRVPRL